MTYPIQFDVTPPLNADLIAQHIAHSTSLGLPEADGAPLKRLTIIANGPSARDAPLSGDTVAVNGALSLFLNSGRAPTYWAACDPQEGVADFLPDCPPKDVIYLVAAKCHPKVFAKLKDRDVRLWHIDDHPVPNGQRRIKCASTITLCVMTLMRRLGYRAFDTYGWDACYEEINPGVITHHASDPTLADYPENTVDLCVGAQQTPDGEFVGGRWFKTSHPWAVEAQDAVIQLHHADYEVKVHGDGLIAAILAGR